MSNDRGSAFHVLNFSEATAETEPAGADGICTATFDSPGGTNFVRVERMVVQCDSSTATNAFVYVGSARDLDLRDGTDAGNLDVADNAQPILVPPGRDLVVQWVGASLGAVGIAHIQFAEVQQLTALGRPY